MIRTKADGVAPFGLNASQMFVHERLEKQRQERGRVRALILKARQWGCSTYVEGRYYWRVTHEKGKRAYILTHEQDATDGIFSMVERFHKSCPELVRPHTGASNAKELYFDLLDSGYGVGTAGGKPVAHGQTIQYFHGSEVARWPNAAEHMTGVLNAVPDAEGTEIILESVAAGAAGMFYTMCKDAERGNSDYELIFVPWFVHEEYASPLDGWTATGEWREYGEQHGLSAEQLYWAYRKSRDLGGTEGGDPDEISWRFREQYPASADEAFQYGVSNPLIHPKHIARARKFEATENEAAPFVIGCDFARNPGSGDRNVFISRQGRRMGDAVFDAFHSDDTVEIANRLAVHLDRFDPDMCFLDAGGGGAQVYDILKAKGYRDQLTIVNFGGKAIDKDRHYNKRAEMYDNMREWFEDEGGVSIPDDDALSGELALSEKKERFEGAVMLEPKEKIREEHGISPDLADAAALTFGGPVSKRARETRQAMRYAKDDWDF